MKTIFLVIAYFTRIPVPYVEYTEERYLKCFRLMPLVGLLLGGILYALSFFHLIFHREVVSLILLAGYISMTGGLHLDGLADTCDGVFSGRDRERMLEIMKDSRVGSFGVLSMIFFVAFYMVMYSLVPYEALILLPVIGKSAALISAYLGKYARPSGMGKLIVDHTGKREIASALLVPAVAAVLIDPMFLIAVAAGLLSATVLNWRVEKVLGGITGDTMGMTCEVSQMVFIFTVYAAAQILKLVV